MKKLKLLFPIVMLVAIFAVLVSCEKDQDEGILVNLRIPSYAVLAGDLAIINIGGDSTVVATMGVRGRSFVISKDLTKFFSDNANLKFTLFIRKELKDSFFWKAEMSVNGVNLNKPQRIFLDFYQANWERMEEPQ
jgi:hypothetical protein